MSQSHDAPAVQSGISGLLRGAQRGGPAAGHKNMLLLIQLRWIAVVGQITAIILVIQGFGVELPLVYMLEVLACLVGFNLACHMRWYAQREVTNGELFLSLLVDVFSLTAQLYLAGGSTNPFAFLYLLQVILGAVLLEAWSTWIIVLATCVCLAGLAVFAQPLRLPPDMGPGIFSLYVEGMLLCFSLDAVLLVFFIQRMNDNVRAGDFELAGLRQRAAEEDHIVRMGLLASGAAHELGTPLATLSVLIGDWRRMPEFRDNPELLSDVAEMQAQLKRCKAIVSGILMSAGELRGESSRRTTLRSFCDELALEWRESRPGVVFDYYNGVVDDVSVAFDSALKQTIVNVLENAYEVSPQWLSLSVTIDAATLVLTVRDDGPGFAAANLAQIGKPYNSSKGKPGGGLGLFLAVNVVRKLGGNVEAHNRAAGGAEVALRLPLASIALEQEGEGDDD
jgi:two-component system sensor histidine kinase RegB